MKTDKKAPRHSAKSTQTASTLRKEELQQVRGGTGQGSWEDK